MSPSPGIFRRCRADSVWISPPSAMVVPLRMRISEDACLMSRTVPWCCRWVRAWSRETGKNRRNIECDPVVSGNLGRDRQNRPDRDAQYGVLLDDGRGPGVVPRLEQ